MSIQGDLFTSATEEIGDNFSFEKQLYASGVRIVAGTDEAGRGPLAGPVVAACVVLPRDCDCTVFKDSKKLSGAARENLYQLLRELDAMIGVGVCSVEEIDRLNILHASLLAMKKAMENLPLVPDFLLVDGKFTIPHQVSQQSLVKGESRSASIAAASIVAKEERDRMMHDLDREYPQYHFARHKGYPTAEHRALIEKHGPSPVHRRSFRGVREFLGKDD
ncbi:MAG: ribonuclease HII [Proteobacteria bacterium]|nr:ribonuclease HII [Pseudomonadota bacterium]MBU1737357.1 ribonuclease HII [Pseudomonadota bacterium]